MLDKDDLYVIEYLLIDKIVKMQKDLSEVENPKLKKLLENKIKHYENIAEKIIGMEMGL